MTTTAERILTALADAAGPLDDDELAKVLKVRRQAINQVCRQLEATGTIHRQVSVGSKIRNVLTGAIRPTRPLSRTEAQPGDLLTEDEVKRAVMEHLQSRGYQVQVTWGHQRGIDIDAHVAGDRIIVEAKGEVSLAPQQVNYFLGALGELVQRMNDPAARYGLALPDNRQYRGLVKRLPPFARQRLDLIVYFVGRTPDGGFTIDEGPPPSL